MMDNKCSTRLCAPALGLAFGILSGLCMLLFAWGSWMWGFGATMMDQYSTIYYGYAPTLVGGLIGGLWGLVTGFIFGIILAWIYNCCARCCGCGKSCPTCSPNVK